jgi:hypothetical protein
MTDEEKATIARAADYAEKQYWNLRAWLDGGPDCRDWVRGDDGPAYPFLKLASRLRKLTEESR